MASNLSRRGLLTAAALGTTSPVWAGLGTTASAAPPGARAPYIFALPVTPDRVVVAVDRRGATALRTVQVLDRWGRVLGTARLSRTGQAIVPISLPRGARQAARVRWGPAGLAADSTVLLDLSANALSSSLWRVVNKRTALEPGAAPAALGWVRGVGMHASAAVKMRVLLTRAGEAGLNLVPLSGYRSFARQRALYQAYVDRDGQAAADTYSARPGHSEHQSGLAIDMGRGDGQCRLAGCFGTTAEGRFLAAYAPASGFVVRYTAANTHIAGYRAEPWHLRYLGPWLATHLQREGVLSVEQAFGLPPAPNYR